MRTQIGQLIRQRVENDIPQDEVRGLCWDAIVAIKARLTEHEKVGDHLPIRMFVPIRDNDNSEVKSIRVDNISLKGEPGIFGDHGLFWLAKKTKYLPLLSSTHPECQSIVKKVILEYYKSREGNKFCRSTNMTKNQYEDVVRYIKQFYYLADARHTVTVVMNIDFDQLKLEALAMLAYPAQAQKPMVMATLAENSDRIMPKTALKDHMTTKTMNLSGGKLHAQDFDPEDDSELPQDELIQSENCPQFPLDHGYPAYLGHRPILSRQGYPEPFLPPCQAQTAAVSEGVSPYSNCGTTTGNVHNVQIGTQTNNVTHTHIGEQHNHNAVSDEKLDTIAAAVQDVKDVVDGILQSVQEMPANGPTTQLTFGNVVFLLMADKQTIKGDHGATFCVGDCHTFGDGTTAELQETGLVKYSYSNGCSQLAYPFHPTKQNMRFWCMNCGGKKNSPCKNHAIPNVE